MTEIKQHWETIYETKPANEVSWFQSYPKTSVGFVELFQLPTDANIIDIGGGDSLFKGCYGKEKPDSTLNLVDNPPGVFMPSPQEALEKEYKQALQKKFGMEFNTLFAMTNLPISRYLDYLLQGGNYEKCMGKLVSAYNPVAASNVMCRNTIPVNWDGYLSECNFN